MKRSLILHLCLWMSLVSMAQTKIALIVAIGEYEKSTGWSSISSQNDVPLIKASLIKQGFNEKDILVLRDAEATKDGILKAIDSHLIERSSKDGIAVFHYSGHGQQLMDDNGDEPDGYDEALVSYNANLRYIPGVYTGQNHIRDEELGGRMEILRRKLGPKGNVLVILDACHSGSGTRGGDAIRKHRGTDKPCAPEGYDQTLKGKKADNNAISGKASDEKNLAAMVGFFGASPHELNYETEDENGNGVGSLSYAFSKAFANADKNTTYGGLFDKIKVAMSGFAPRQTPQAEGDLRNTILGGKIVGKLNYFKVDKWEDEKTVKLNAGEILGLFKDSKVAFYDIDTKDPGKAKPKATGIITATSLTDATVTLDNSLEKVKAMESWVFVVEKNYGKLEVKVKLDIGNDQLKKSIISEFEKYPFIKLVPQNSDLIIDEGNKYSRGSQLTITSSTDMLLMDEPVDANIEKTTLQVIESVKSYSQASYIRGLDVNDSRMDVKFEFIPITVKQEGDKFVEVSRQELSSKKDESGNLVFKGEKDAFKLKITNNGNKAVYFTIIDIQPNNIINLVIPNPATDRKAIDYRITPGQSLELDDDDIMIFYPPYGNEVFKLIATETPLDLSSIITTRGESSRGDVNSNPFSGLFSESFKTAGSRGPRMPNVPNGSANIYTVTFKVVE
ncbi:MAG: caspase family protein [Flavobacteriales bacterium]|nr:caspase family protein [Flavobacteriales bacterium]